MFDIRADIQHQAAEAGCRFDTAEIVFVKMTDPALTQINKS